MRTMMFNSRYGLEKAVLARTKDLTRRDGAKVRLDYEIGLSVVHILGFGRKETLEEFAIRKAPFKVGDIVPVAQSYETILEDVYHGQEENFCNRVLQAHGKKKLGEVFGWTNKMYVKSELMPHHIKIKSIRFEQLKCISDEECLREGIYRRDDVLDLNLNPVVRYQYYGNPAMFKSPREAYASLIDKLGGKGTWDRNEFQYVYEFELVN